MMLEKFTNLSQQWRRINALWYKVFMNFLNETSFTYTEAIVLLATLSLNKPSKSDISNYMRCEPQSITRAINSLVSKGLLQRNVDSQDKRVVRFDLTPPGREFSIKTQEFINTNWQKSLGHMDNADLSAFTNYLDEMINNLDHLVKTNEIESQTNK
ncbi:MarR family winged helix-turn-helix transcriptional regulator [Francisella sp. 19X1-34]|uniref:MarR family winged helix-turn-helix transcriptional regulator n=1 Tax=Francisella sp. 19X1-34 TaxID=3087177 RepID=UPI002E320A8F|nr:MarR family winged helix-turn-helix transcriptional regulator [Francisella sp. 19X1-34]MED7789292.1 MarR family winged helix-turn-helix transcriptional regulator [Francisella sp. 19X1-34]